MNQEKAKFNIFSNKSSLVLLFILGFLIAIFGVAIFGTYFILNTLGFSYALLVMTVFVLVLMIIYKEKNKLILSNIILLSISIILQFAFIFSRDYILSFFTSVLTAVSGILFSIIIATLYKNNSLKDETTKHNIDSNTNLQTSNSTNDENKKCNMSSNTNLQKNDSTNDETKKCNISLDINTYKENSLEDELTKYNISSNTNLQKNASTNDETQKYNISLDINTHKDKIKKLDISSITVSKIITITVAIICIACIVILHTFAISAMYYSSLPIGFAKEYKDVSYGPYGKRNTMTIYVPKSALDREENAAMIYLHPGGWNAGDKNICSSDARRAAKQGYITMFMNYRFLNDSNDFDMDDLLDDITLALKEFKKYSTKYNWNVTKISLNGYSAGAHLSMLYGYKCKNECPFEISYIAAKAGVFIFNEPSYYPAEIVYTGGVFGGGLHNSPLRNDPNGNRLPSKEVIYKEEVLQKLKEISPATYISDDNPPLIQCYANADDIISFKQVADIKALLALKPFENEIIVCDGCSHLFFENHKDLKAYYVRVSEWAKHFFGY